VGETSKVGEIVKNKTTRKKKFRKGRQSNQGNHVHEPVLLSPWKGSELSGQGEKAQTKKGPWTEGLGNLGNDA